MSGQRQIGHAVSEMRRSLGLSQVEFAKRIGMVQAQVSAIEVGDRKLTFAEAISIADEFGISLDVLAGRGEKSAQSTEVLAARTAIANIHEITLRFAKAVSA